MGLCLTFAVAFESDGLIRIIAVLAFITSLFLAVSVFVMKKGLVIDNQGINVGYFSWGKLILKDPITTLNVSAVSLLKFKRRERGAYMSIANPEFSTSFNTFEIYLLNKKHTIKNKIITLRREENAISTIEFITRNSDFKHEIYSPDFS